MNYTTNCQKENLRAIRSFLSERLSQLNISSIEKHQLILATDEACANAIIHGNNCDKNRELCVEVEITDFDITIEIYDIGSYRPNERVSETRDIRQNIRAKQKGGLGLRLMH
ncbi:MAG: ATP-binding protein, partial [Chitinophagales bacterium]